MVQDVFLLVHRNSATFDSSKSPARFWILPIAYHRAISRRRYLTSRHFYTRLDLDGAASELADPRAKVGQFEDSIDGRLGNGGLQRVFEALSENQRQTLRLHFSVVIPSTRSPRSYGNPKEMSDTTISGD
jgi:DNA-directed RNA polymerase specialized sigma24 family protein